MPTANERRALIFLAALGALGVTVRAFRASAAQGSAAAPPAHVALDRHIASVDSATLARRTRTAGRERAKRPGVPRDSAESGAVPDARRPRGRAVTGVDVGAEVATAPHPLALYEGRRLEVARANQLTQARIDRDRDEHAPAAPSGRQVVDLDAANPTAIEALPGVGAVLAARIVADRTARGPFGSLDGLQRVHGVGPGLASRIAPLVTFSGSPAVTQPTVKLRAARVRPIRP
jgi:competence protein ComEA